MLNLATGKVQMLRKRPVIFIIFLIFFVIGIFSCSTQRRVLLNSLPNDDSWFTRAKRLALVSGKKDDFLGYFWTSKTIYINERSNGE
jgi:hypothetical protein